jgi:hypothetical protein
MSIPSRTPVSHPKWDVNHRQVFGLTGILLNLVAVASQPLDQCFNDSFRSCLPLRGSYGISPYSLFTPAGKPGDRWQLTE